MCVITAGAGISAAAALTANLAIAGIGATAAIAGVTGIQQRQQAQAALNMQAQQQELAQEQQRISAVQQQEQLRQQQNLQIQQEQSKANLQVQQANQSIMTQYEQQVRATNQERENIMSRFTADKSIYQRSVENAQKQFILNEDAVNTAYQQEQTKLQEVRQKAAFETQAQLAKSIGMKGKILASGRTGQSVGLLASDVDRQQGFVEAAKDASVRSATNAASIGMDTAFNQAQSANANAFSKIGFNPQQPYLPEMPGSPRLVDPIGLAIPVEAT